MNKQPRPNLRIIIWAMYNWIQLTFPAVKSMPKLFNSVRSLCPSFPNKVTNMWSSVPAYCMSPVVSSSLYSAMVTQWILSKKKKRLTIMTLLLLPLLLLCLALCPMAADPGFPPLCSMPFFVFFETTSLIAYLHAGWLKLHYWFLFMYADVLR